MIIQIPPNTIQHIAPVLKALSSLSPLSSILANVDEAIRNDLESNRNSWFTWLIASTVAVFIGVVLEEAEGWLPYLKQLFPLQPITEYRLTKKLAKLGWMFIVVGVMGEGVFEVLVSRADAKLQRFDAALLGEARKEARDAVLGAATANIEVAEAKQRTAALEKEAAHLQKDAEDAQLARVKIEDAVAWRRLTKEQISEMGTNLAIFPRQLTALVYNANDLEAYSFATDIDVALHEFAKWNVAEPQAVLMMREGPVNFGTNPPLERGVVVNSTSDEGSRAAAKTVVGKLSAFGFDAFIGKPIPKERPTVQIFVEPRPEGPQGAAKLRIEAEKQQKANNAKP